MNESSYVLGCYSLCFVRLISKDCNVKIKLLNIVFHNVKCKNVLVAQDSLTEIANNLTHSDVLS